MNNKTKNSFLSKRSLNLGIAFVIVALVAGVYFLFRPFPAGTSLDVKAEVPEAASIAGWNRLANSSELALRAQPGATSASLQRLDIGAGYFLENDQQGSRIVAPSVPSVSSSAVQRLDIGSGYMLEFNQAGGRIVAPASPAAAVTAAQESRLVPSSVLAIIGSGYERGFLASNVAEPASAQEPGLIPSSVRAVIGSGYERNFTPASSVQRLDIGAGYVLVTDAQGTRIVSPTLQTAAPTADYLTKIDIGSGYMLVLGPGGQGEIVRAP